MEEIKEIKVKDIYLQKTDDHVDPIAKVISKLNHLLNVEVVSKNSLEHVKNYLDSVLIHKKVTIYIGVVKDDRPHINGYV